MGRERARRGRGGAGAPTGVPTALIYSCNIFRSSRAAEIYKGGKARTGSPPPDRELLSSD